MTRGHEEQLASYERRYRELARQLAEVGYIASGSVALRANRCGKANCACHGEPPRLHGPYWHFTAKVGGKTVNKLLSEREANLYREWIDNDRKARLVLAEMREVAAKAQALMLATGSDPARQKESAPSPRTRRVASRHSG